MSQDVTADDVKSDIITSTTDLVEVRARLETWLAERVGSTGPVRVTSIRRPESSGMSSISVLFDAEWTTDGRASARSWWPDSRRRPPRSRCSPTTT